MADKNQLSSSEKDKRLKVPWPENSLIPRRMNRYVAEWDKQKVYAANTKTDEITKKRKYLGAAK